MLPASLDYSSRVARFVIVAVLTTAVSAREFLADFPAKFSSIGFALSTDSCIERRQKKMYGLKYRLNYGLRYGLQYGLK
jgi:hypothetical protein